MADVTLPAWTDAAARRRPSSGRVDGWAIERARHPGLELMERAGAGLVDELVERAARDGRVAVVCGKGNNGGDGLVAARLLRERGREVDVLMLGARRRAARRRPRQLRAAARRGRRAVLGRALLGGAAVIVDAILGTGFSGEPREPAPLGDRGDQRGR